MTDITERLRSIYVAEGTNYVQEAADLIDKLRAELDRANEYHAVELADLAAERDALVNDVHSCHNNCTRAGCVAARLRDVLQLSLRWGDAMNEQERQKCFAALEKTK